MKRKLVPRTRNHGTFTEAQFNGWLTSMLRRGSRAWKPKNEAKKLARLPEKKRNPKTGRFQFCSTCASCGNWCFEADVEMDHVVPVVDPAVGFVSWDEKIERMYPEIEGYQALCPDCHTAKTKAERAIATERRRNERKAGSKETDQT